MLSRQVETGVEAGVYGPVVYKIIGTPCIIINACVPYAKFGVWLDRRGWVAQDSWPELK